MCGACGQTEDWAAAWYSHRHSQFTMARFVAHRSHLTATPTASGLFVANRGQPRLCRRLDELGTALARWRPTPSWAELRQLTESASPHRPVQLARRAVPTTQRRPVASVGMPEATGAPDPTRDLHRLVIYVWGLAAGLAAPNGLVMCDDDGAWAVISPQEPHSTTTRQPSP